MTRSLGLRGFAERGFKKVSRESWRLKKILRHQSRRGVSQRRLLVFGCQRSGTSMVTRVLEADAQCRVFYEFSRLSAKTDEGLVWRPLGDVDRMMSRSRAPFVVGKPLVESHRVIEVLDELGDASGVWMYRHFQDVVGSNLVRWGSLNGHADLSSFLDVNANDWRSASATSATRSVVSKLLPGASDNDAAALFWWARNQLFFDQALEHESRVRLVRYEDLVASPAAEVEQLYSHTGVSYPGDEIVSLVGSKSVGKGSEVQFSADISALCNEMLERLDSVRSSGSEGK